MKKNIFKTLAALFVFGSLVLTSCVQNFEGTKPNYEQKKEQFTGNYGNKNSASGKGQWSFSVNSNITTASKTSEVTVTISYIDYELDLDSVESAFTFYRLKDNSKYKYFCPEHDGEITKTLLKVTEPNQYNGWYDITFLYRLDTSEVTTSKIAFIVDATKLKYKNGLFVVSNDGNLKAGETTDSIVMYINVTNKADGTTTTALNNSYDENFAPVYTISSSSFYKRVDLEDLEGNLTGKTRYYVYAPAKTYESPYTYDESLADTLSKMFKLEIQKPGSTKWESGDTLTFAYHADSKSGDNVDPYYAHTYTTDTPVLEAGTKWRIVQDSSVSIGAAPDWYADRYGHPVFKDDRKVLTTVSEGIVPYGDKDTELLFAYGNTGTPGTFTKYDCDYSSALITQSNILYYFWNDGSKFTISVDPSYAELDQTDGFILVNTAKKNAIVPSVTTVHKNADGKIDKVFIAPKDANIELNGDFDIYVGSGTTLKENKDYPKQLKFGCYPDQSKGELSGYVMLVQNLSQYLVLGGDEYNSAIDWYGATGFEIETTNYRYYDDSTGKDSNHFIKKKVYLIAGNTYKLQVANGYVNGSYTRNAFLNTVYSEIDTEFCYSGEVYLFDADLGDPDFVSPYNYKMKVSYDDTTGTASFNCTKTGFYWLCVNHAYYVAYDEDVNLTSIVSFPHSDYLEQTMSLNGYTGDWYYDAYVDASGNWILTEQANDDNGDPVTDTSGNPVLVPALLEYEYDDVNSAVIVYNGTNPNYPLTYRTYTGHRALNPTKYLPYYKGDVFVNLYSVPTL